MTTLTDLPLFWVTILAAILFAAGMTKGVIGIGLPIVAVPLLSLIVPLPTAVGMVAIPLILTNLVQACTGGPIPTALKALWPVLAGTMVGLIVGVELLTGLSPEILKPVVGAVLIAVAALMLLAPKLHCHDRVAPVAAPLVGVGGILGGLAGQPGPIVFLYLLSRGINGSRFVQCSSMYVALASTALTLALGGAVAIGFDGVTVSAVCTIPILLGMWVGQRVREGVPTALFRRLVLGMVILGGISMVEPALSIIFTAHASETAVAAQHRFTR
jgi:uncharacterized membrane protein YfcA